MASLLVGTSGYGYLEWIGPVYPEGSRPEDLLRIYASMFPTVELNSASYRMPLPQEFERLADEAGPPFVFSVKADDALTHRVDPASWKGEARAFSAALGPLARSGRLGAVLLQFPPSFPYEADRRRYLDALLGELAGLPLAVEFRNSAWYNNRVLDAFRERRVAIASPDLPDLKGLPPLMDVVTAPLAYVRLHGRNREAWWGSDAAARYDYLYGEAELRSWAARLRGIAARADRILVYFNNYRRGQAALNARTLGALLAQAGLASAGPAP
jgi:uncharacterized protein YecE (DUF72 family)